MEAGAPSADGCGMAPAAWQHDCGMAPADVAGTTAPVAAAGAEPRTTGLRTVLMYGVPVQPVGVRVWVWVRARVKGEGEGRG